MALRAQIAAFCVIVGVVSADVFMNHRHHRGPYGIKDFQQILADMFHPTGMQGILQIKPMNHPGILGFGSFGGRGIGDYNDAMMGSGQERYGLDDSLPVAPSLMETDEVNSPGPMYNFDESELKYSDGNKPSQDVTNYNNDEREQNNHPDNKIKDVEESGAKEGGPKSDDSTEKDKAPVSHKNESEDDSIIKHRDKDAIVFPDTVKQARDKIAKESNYYISPQSTNGYVSPGPQIVYAVSIGPSGLPSNQAPFVSNTATSTIQTQPTETAQNNPTTNMNVQNPQPQYQMNENVPIGNGNVNNAAKNPGYTLVTIPSNSNDGVNRNNPTYVPSNTPSYGTQQVNYQPFNTAQQYYIVSINGQNMLVPVSNIQTVPNQINGDKQFNLVPINQGAYNGQVSSQNTPPTQNNGQVQYIAIQLPPQNNNQMGFVPINQGVFQTPGQNTAQEGKFVPVNAQTVIQMPPQNTYNQVPYVTANTPQTVQATQQSNPQGSNQVTYVPVNSQTVIQGAPDSTTNSGQVTYVPLNSQNPQITSQYNLVPLNYQNNGQNNVVTLTPAHIISGGNVPLIVFKEKAEVTRKKVTKHKKD